MVPLFGLYGLSILLVGLAERRRDVDDLEDQDEDEDHLEEDEETAPPAFRDDED
jgi:hypothetical protein